MTRAPEADNWVKTGGGRPKVMLVSLFLDPDPRPRRIPVPLGLTSRALIGLP